MAVNVITCRFPLELLERIDEQVAQLRADGANEKFATRSSVIRTLLAQQLVDDPQGLLTREILGRTYQVLQEVTAKAMALCAEKLPEITAQVLNEADLDG